MSHVTGVNSQLDLIKDGSVQQTGQPAQPAAAPQAVQPAPVAAPLAPAPAPAPKDEAPKPVSQEKPTVHAGLDIGTMNIIAARQVEKNTEFKRIRDVFIDLTDDQIKLLKLSNDASYVTIEEQNYLLGDQAADVANIFGRKLRAPMHQGVIAPGELEAMNILKVMVGEVLGQAPEGGVCSVSSPGDPIDSSFDALYHQAVIQSIVESFGWKVECASEATAMAYSECSDSNFTGLCLSFGHGMTNISLVFSAIETLKFSVARGGSWLDEQTAKVTGKTPSQITAIKEKGLDLLKPVGREQSALSVYYKHLIGYVVQNFISKFRELQGNIELPNDIPIVIAGGTSLPKNFVELVKQEITKNKGFPFPISEVRHAKDPLNSIAKGLLVMSQNR